MAESRQPQLGACSGIYRVRDGTGAKHRHSGLPSVPGSAEIPSNAHEGIVE